MSRSSASEGIERQGNWTGSPGRPSHQKPTRTRGQVEPIAALVAVFTVGLAISLYATALPDAGVGTPGDETAETTLSVVYRNISDGGVVRPQQVKLAPGVAPPGYDVNVTLAVAGETWLAGPVPPESARSASRRVSVRLAPGNVRPGRLTVVVWS